MRRARIREPFVTGQRRPRWPADHRPGAARWHLRRQRGRQEHTPGRDRQGLRGRRQRHRPDWRRGREVTPLPRRLPRAQGDGAVRRCRRDLRTDAAHACPRSQVAITIADHYRATGLNVMLMMDSLTRLAMAQRELGLALGEPPSARGYTPSCFQLLANTVERLGNAEVGSITGILTVLVDGGDMDEPISDAVRLAGRRPLRPRSTPGGARPVPGDEHQPEREPRGPGGDRRHPSEDRAEAAAKSWQPTPTWRI